MTTAAHTQTLDDLFRKYSDDRRFEYVSIGKGMLSIAGFFGAADEQTKAIFDKINQIKILALTDGFDDTLQREVLDEVKDVTQEQFETLVEVRDGSERVFIYRRTSQKDIDDLLLVTQDESEVVLIWVLGRLSVEELMEMVK